MKRGLVALLIVLSVSVSGQKLQLSDQARFSLITLGPDQSEFYEAFGHSAIRLIDSLNHLDLAFNYGEFSFNQPNFYLNFAKGHLNYSLGVVPWADFREAYIYYNRSIREQVLNLNAQQRQIIFDYLVWNAEPQNKYYLYDYFFNNCSTKIRDLLTDLLPGQVHYDQSWITTTYTIRQLSDLYLELQPWGDLGIDIGLGSRIDKKALPLEYMYLPDYLELSFDHAAVLHDGKQVPLVSKKTVLFTAQPEDDSPGWLRPWIVFGFLFFVTVLVTVYDYRRKKLTKWIDVILLTVTGFLGVVLALLWFATDHHACAWNLNLAWALPFNLIVVFAIFKKAPPVWLTFYFRIAATILGILLLFWWILPQQLNANLIILLSALLLRYLVNTMAAKWNTAK